MTRDHFRQGRPSTGDRVGVAAATILLGLALAGCGDGPFVVFPGGALSGETKSVPSDWAFAGDYGTVQLESNPAEPYSVNIAYTVMDGRVYINAGDTETQWVQHINGDSNVRLRLDGVLYDLRAVRVRDTGTIERFGQAWTDQSMFRRDPADLEGEVWIYELVAR